MIVGVSTAMSQEEEPLSITAESTGCETVTIHYYVGYRDSDTGEFYPYNSQGTVNGDVRNGNGVGSSQIVFTNVASGLAVWSGSMFNLAGSESYFDQGTVQVDPCPVTTTTTTQPTDTPTSSSTIAQVETDLPDGPGPGFGLIAALAAIGVSLLGGVTMIAARREN